MEQTLKSRLFISYSRADKNEVEQLVKALEAFDYAVIYDRQGIHGAEQWEKRLSQMILEADTVVFVLTPTSATSEVCRWEVDRAIERGKRIVPVVTKPLAGSEPHEALRDRNYIYFYDEPSALGSGWGSGLAHLRAALAVDIDWIREHTRVSELAARWIALGRPLDLLVRGSELASYKAWRDRRPANAPELTASQRDFIQASEEAEKERESGERLRLDDMRQALEAAAGAQRDREAALKILARRSFMWTVSAGALTLLAGGAATFAYFENKGRVAAESAWKKDAGREDIEGQVVAQASSAGEEAMAVIGNETNSPYTTTLLKHLERDPKKSLLTALASANQEVRELVLATVRRSQRPFLSSDLNGDIYLLQQPVSRKRKALVAYCDTFGGRPIANTDNDANRWAALFKRAGFEVKLLTNPTKIAFEHAVQETRFSAESPQRNTIAAFFFAGVGTYVSGTQYIIPADITQEELADKEVLVAENKLVGLPYLQDAFRKSAAASILIFDTDFGALN